MGSKPIDAEAKATLSFIQPVANLGRVDSKELIHTAFEFNVPNGSSPVRIVREDDFQSPGAAGLYPAGEGAGYAGGIVTSAIDGLRAADALLASMK